MADWLDIVFGLLVGFVFVGLEYAKNLRGEPRPTKLVPPTGNADGW